MEIHHKLVSHFSEWTVNMPSSSRPAGRYTGFSAAAFAALVLLTAPAAFAQGTAAPAKPATPESSAACPALLQHTFPRLQDEKPQSLCQYAGRVLLVVNTASYCGFTSQYKGLETLNAKYKDRGLVVLGFPSNDFAQETGSNTQIADFCENTFGVKFPMFAKTSVTGEQAAPLFKQLAALSGQKPRWNFYKYLIGRDGQVAGSYSSMTSPEDRALVRDIEKQLSLKQYR